MHTLGCKLTFRVGAVVAALGVGGPGGAPDAGPAILEGVLVDLAGLRGRDGVSARGQGAGAAVGEARDRDRHRHGHGRRGRGGDGRQAARAVAVPCFFALAFACTGGGLFHQSSSILVRG